MTEFRDLIQAKISAVTDAKEVDRVSAQLKSQQPPVDPDQEFRERQNQLRQQRLSLAPDLQAAIQRFVQVNKFDQMFDYVKNEVWGGGQVILMDANYILENDYSNYRAPIIRLEYTYPIRLAELEYHHATYDRKVSDNYEAGWHKKYNTWNEVTPHYQPTGNYISGEAAEILAVPIDGFSVGTEIVKTMRGFNNYKYNIRSNFGGNVGITERSKERGLQPEEFIATDSAFRVDVEVLPVQVSERWTEIMAAKSLETPHATDEKVQNGAKRWLYRLDPEDVLRAYAGLFRYFKDWTQFYIDSRAYREPRVANFRNYGAISLDHGLNWTLGDKWNQDSEERLVVPHPRGF